MKKVKYYLKTFLFSILLLLIIATLANCVPFGKYLFNYSDAYVMYPSLLIHSVKEIFDGNFFFNLQSALGSDFYNVRTLYMNSPLNLLLIFFKSENIFDFYTFLIYLRTGLSALTMCIYLNSRSREKYTWKQVIFGIIYSLSSYSVAYNVHIMWMDSFVLLPLIIKGLDKLIKEDKVGEYMFFLTLSIMINFYIGYMICIFCLLYFIYKSYVINQFNFKKIKKFIFSSLLCGLMCSVVLIPQIFSLLAGRGNTFDVNKLKGISIFSLLTMPVNLISGTFSYPDILTNGSPMIYCTIFVIVMNVLYYANKEITKREKKASTILTIFFFLSLFINIIDFTWNMFQEPRFFSHRYSFVIIFFLMTIAFDNLEKKEGITLKKTYVILIIFFLLCLGSFWFKSKSYLVPSTYIIGLYLSVIIFTIYLCIIKKSKSKYIIIICIMLELVYNGYATLYETTSISVKTANKYINTKKLFEPLKEYDTTFYRTLMPQSANNDSMLFDFYSGEMFSSSFNYNIKEFLTKKVNFSRKSMNVIGSKANNPALLSLFAFKYVVGKSNFYEEIVDNAFINDKTLSIGFVVPGKIEEPNLIDYDYFNNIDKIYSSLIKENVSLFSTVTIDKYDVNEFIDESNAIKHQITLSFTANSTGALIPCNSDIYNSMRIKKNGAFLKEEWSNYENSTKSYNDYIISVEKGDCVELSFEYYEKEIELYDLDLDNQDCFSVVILDETLFEEAIKKLQKYNVLENISTESYVISGNVNCSEGTLFLSIPYLDGLKVLVDNQEKEIQKVFDSFIGVEVSEGKHKIVVKYLPKGFKSGSLMSIAGIILTFLYFVINKKKKFTQ